MLCSHGEPFSGTPHCTSKLETERAGRNSGKTRKGFHHSSVPLQMQLSSAGAAVSMSFAITSSHPMPGTTDSSFVDSAVCNGDGRKLRGVVIHFKPWHMRNLFGGQLFSLVTSWAYQLRC